MSKDPLQEIRALVYKGELSAIDMGLLFLHLIAAEEEIKQIAEEYALEHMQGKTIHFPRVNLTNRDVSVEFVICLLRMTGLRFQCKMKRGKKFNRLVVQELNEEGAVRVVMEPTDSLSEPFAFWIRMSHIADIEVRPTGSDTVIWRTISDDVYYDPIEGLRRVAADPARDIPTRAGASFSLLLLGELDNGKFYLPPTVLNSLSDLLASYLENHDDNRKFKVGSYDLPLKEKIRTPHDIYGGIL